MSKRKNPGNSPEAQMKKDKKAEELEEEKLSGDSSCITEILQDTETNPKSLFICMFHSFTGLPSLTRTDVQGGLFHEVVQLDYPDHVRRSNGYSVAVLGSKFYFMGGHSLSVDYDDRFDIFRSVSIFRTVSVIDLQKPSPSWETAAPMKQPRIHSIVFTYKKNIYVFGSSADGLTCFTPYTELTTESYAEYYDSVLDDWFDLPAPIPEEMVQPGRVILSHALNHDDGIVYFWVWDIGVYLYNLEANTWDKWRPFKDRKLLPSPFPNDPCQTIDLASCGPIGPIWSKEVVFLRNFLIWHSFGTMYAFRFSGAPRLFTLFTFDDSTQIFGDPLSSDSSQPVSYLLNVGNGKLCLVHGFQKMSGETKCHVFSVRFSGSPPDDVQIVLQYEKSEGSGVTCHSISAVLTVNSEILRI